MSHEPLTSGYVQGSTITAIRHLALKGALKLEVLGMRRSRGMSAYAMVKKEFGFKGSKQAVLDQLTTYCQEHYS